MERTQRTQLEAARKRKHWTRGEVASLLEVDVSTVQRWEKGEVSPYPRHIHRLCEIYGQSAVDLGLEKTTDMITHLSLGAASAKEMLNQCASGVAACGTLSDIGGHQEIAVASQIISTYLPMLSVVLKEVRYHEEASARISQILQIKQRLAYHLEGIGAALHYADEALDYARESHDATMTVMALRELASVYEWPMDHVKPQQRRRKSLTLSEEGVHILEQHSERVPPLVQSWAYGGLAKFQALNGLKQEMYETIGKAEDTFALSSPNQALPGFHLDEVNLIRQEAIAYAYAGSQSMALDKFLQLVDINDEHIAPKLPTAHRTHLSILSEATFSSLKLPAHKKDKELSMRLWLKELEEARELQSETYTSEANIAYRIMEAIWPEDGDVLELRDLIQ